MPKQSRTVLLVVLLFEICQHISGETSCWTGWFDRDNPSGTGDWETLTDLRKENPGKICDSPLEIEAQTTSGASMASTGDVIAVCDKNTGFVCKNSDQKRGMCKDYRVRFKCPCMNTEPTCWTTWFDRDNPSGTGDWETLSLLRNENPGKICNSPLNIEVQTTSGASMGSTGDVIAAADETTGFICKNSDQKSGMCKDYRVRFQCPYKFCTNTEPACWTGWFDRDNPSGTGDWETLSNLRTENPGKICNSPLNIEVQTTSGASMGSTGDVIAAADAITGFVCKNSDQKSGMCKDYRVRFQCPSRFCSLTAPTCWTGWFDRDNPSGTGDWETLSLLRNENPGKICDGPLNIEIQTTSGASMASTGDVIAAADEITGFICKNSDQKDEMCKDYRVRFQCPSSFCSAPTCWTGWFDRDNPSGTGDWETLSNLRTENPGKICNSALNIEVQTTSGASMASTGDVIAAADPTTGFICKNKDQKSGLCKDYRVRFQCPYSFCTNTEPTCWTAWFDRDNPSATGDWENLINLRNENPGKICISPLNIEVQTTSGASMDSTGDVIAAADPVTGFICKNSDQKSGMCKDYRVRFQCPYSFCINPVPTCWTGWFDRDDPSATGDWETLTDLRKENPGKICDSALNIDVQTTSGASMASTGDVIAAADATTGFICKNSDQKSGNCEDYRVRFQCSSGFCTNTEPACWTDWFDRDNPSGTGDWETLSNLQNENPGKICNSPLNIEVQTTSGASMGSTGDVIAAADKTTGFICKNKDQKSGLCKDYRVRFQCPYSFCSNTAPTCWTGWFDRDNPSGTGDWETLSLLRNENPGKICDSALNIEVQTTSGASMASTGDVIAAADKTTGFICKNSDQKSGMCKDYRVRFQCPSSFCTNTEPACLTGWFDRDNPSGTGDWETLSLLRNENPGKICNSPLNIEVQTTSGASMGSTGDVIAVADETTGFVCKNADQKNGYCEDYRVRFQCPSSFCTNIVPTCWTGWFDRDDPSATGDWETLIDLRNENPGKICDSPFNIEVQTTSGASMGSTGDVISTADAITGFVCQNSDQKSGMCKDYRVRFQCPSSFCTNTEQKCWTDWFDRDNPSGTGDWETLFDLRGEYPGKICHFPTEITVQTTSGASMTSTGDVISVADYVTGFICKNSDQKSGICKDYRVRFQCPVDFCNQKVCWTKWYDRDNPSGSGDWEYLKDLRKADPTGICEKPLFIDVVTTEMEIPFSATAQTPYVYSPTEGFVCRNADQKSGQCSDYKVRFGCPCRCKTVFI